MDIEKLQQAIASLEAQRPILGDEVVETALASLRDKLASLQQPPTQPDPDHQAIEQRRLVTVLFADLVGSTALAEKLDPEDLRDALNNYFSDGPCASKRNPVRWKSSSATPLWLCLA